MVPGSVGIVAALVVMSRVGETTPYAVIVGAHLLLMVSLAATFTPAFTLGLGSLPAHLYSHGSSLLGTAQQVAAAIGTAVAITVLSSRAADLAADGASPGAAFVGGMQTAFTAAAGHRRCSPSSSRCCCPRGCLPPWARSSAPEPLAAGHH